MRLIILGAPGSGKGTIAAELTKKYNILHISTGDIFRANIKEKTPLGIKAKEADDIMLYGRGAGGAPTASAVVGDVVMAARNIETIDELPSIGANVYDILKRDQLVITKAGVEALEARLK